MTHKMPADISKREIAREIREVVLLHRIQGKNRQYLLNAEPQPGGGFQRGQSRAKLGKGSLSS